MEITSFIPSSDNLYKFIFVGGIGLFIFAIVHPLERKQQLEIEVNSYQFSLKEDSIDIANLNREVAMFQEYSKSLIHLMDSLNSKSNRNKLLLDSLAKNYSTKLAELRQKSLELVHRNNKMVFEEKKVELLKKHIGDFNMYARILLILGPIFVLYGFWNWKKVSSIIEKMQEVQLKNLKKK